MLDGLIRILPWQIFFAKQRIASEYFEINCSITAMIRELTLRCLFLSRHLYRTHPPFSLVLFGLHYIEMLFASQYSQLQQFRTRHLAHIKINCAFYLSSTTNDPLNSWFRDGAKMHPNNLTNFNILHRSYRQIINKQWAISSLWICLQSIQLPINNEHGISVMVSLAKWLFVCHFFNATH